MSLTAERRRYSRIDFNTSVQLTQGEQQTTASLLDISLNGLLVKTPQHYHIDVALPIFISVELADDANINMKTSLAHSSSDVLGFRCESIDIESIGHLRRLVELNLGDDNAAERVLTELLPNQ
ncbi:PilZ domain-containing protein [Teredinibacter haidensis]|uniref:PilZ domain-containing protein n=1 Tax=Teredinibacter haidensis TaxID=2731755 RepID=UPI000948F8CF|nr:PilZ domain-containing protein [Teredinibacter haidensis]